MKRAAENQSAWRALLKQRRAARIAIAAALLGGATVLFIREWRASRPMTGISDYAYFTTDDSLRGTDAVNALFVDSVSRVPPFDHDGKVAVRAEVFKANGTRWVNDLRRFNAGTVPKVQAAYAHQIELGYKSDPDLTAFFGGLEVKAPGAGTWVAAQSSEGLRILAAHPPAGVNDADIEIDVP